MFRYMFGTPESTVDGTVWLQAMLDVEAALATAEARAGVIPAEAAADIAHRCRAELFDAESVAQRAADSATPVIPLVRDLTALVPSSAAAYVHHGATSQDIVDTAAMLIIRRVLDAILDDLRGTVSACADLTRRHRDTIMVARSLLQQALPTTFGRTSATWLVGLLDAVESLGRLRRERLAVQFGGPAGTLASLGAHGTEVAALLAEELGLVEPDLPWHTDRTRIGELAGALGTTSGVLGKLALDVKLHAQTEVGELTEASPGGSSAMPHKRNPTRAVLISATATRVPGLVSTLMTSMVQEQQRGAGAWQAEWEPLTELLRLVAASAAHARELLSGLQVHADRMAENLDLLHGVIMAESAAAALSPALGRTAARDLVARLCQRALDNGSTLRAELLADSDVRSVLSESDIEASTDPPQYLGSAETFVDRALARASGVVS